MSRSFFRSVLICPLVFVLACMAWLATTTAAQAQESVQAAATHFVIGSGTAASCESQDAANALDQAVKQQDEITFDCGSAPVTIIVNTNVVTRSVVIDGAGLVTLSGANLRQIFLLSGSANLTLNNLTLTDGQGFGGAAIAVNSAQASATINNSFLISHDSGNNNGGAVYNVGTLTINNSTLGSNRSGSFGGAIFNNGGTVTVRNTTIINNEAQQGGGIWHSEGTVTVENSIIRFNRSTGAGGGLHIDTGTVNVTNSTFYDNRATGGGGGIYMRGNNLTITNSTFTQNRANTAGALWNFSGTTTVKNTIFNNSRLLDDSAASLNCDGPAVVSAGRNIISDNSCVPNPGNMGDLLGTDPKLEAFINDNGGPTRSFMLLADSPAIDYALDCPATDQRGIARPLGTGCDVGAIEYATFTYLPLINY